MMNPALPEQLLSLLKAAQGAPLSGETICAEFGVTRTAVWKHIRNLRAAGYKIEAHPRLGYQLFESPDVPSAAEVVPLLTTTRIGHDCRYTGNTGSTNRDAMALAARNEPEGIAVVAGQQTAGRGRQTREWFSPPDANLYFSLVLRPDVEFSRAASLPLVTGLAVAQALADIAPEAAPQIKWPNDILSNGKKICGILCEMQAETARVIAIVPGIGVNVNLAASDFPPELRARATSLRAAAGHPFSRAAVLAAILNRFEPLYDIWRHEGLSPLLPEILRKDALKGKTITLDRLGTLITGTANGVAPDGALLLLTKDGAILPVYSGEAHIGAMTP